ncbi:MAG TPA: sigma-70 family RNA polymerase sigma factor [Gemmataceae bacterium]|nr:sigma-70 family RNA polymerase sigma factor [Gemmataceae bacterium]
MGLPGSQGSVQKLVDEHYAALYRYAFRLAGSASDADDLTQETFCKAQLNLRQLRDPERVKPWLFRILRNVYLHKLRAEKQEQSVSLEDVSELPERLPDSLPPIEPGRLQEALNQLPEVFRTPIILYYFEDFNYRDIAEQMELPMGTVMSRLARAKAHLRSRLLPAAQETVAESRRRNTNGL